jgi:trehalose-phosphatase
MDKLKTHVSSHPSVLHRIFLFSDFDGTLAPIRKDPKKVTLSLQAQKVLRKLACHIPLAIISGRSLAFLKTTIAIPEVILAGNHGLEIEMGRHRFIHPKAVACKKEIKQFARGLKKQFLETTGVLIEEKGLTLTFHYRLVSPSKRKSVCNLFYDYFKTFPHASLLTVRSGKMSLEIRPNIDWEKKDAILWILERYKKRFPEQKVIPIYIGDDETDRSALAMIKKIGISIAVGVPISATYFLPSQSKCIELLRQIQLELTHQ